MNDILTIGYHHENAKYHVQNYYRLSVQISSLKAVNFINKTLTTKDLLGKHFVEL